MEGFNSWWLSLSGESKAAIIAAIVGPIMAVLLGLPMRLIRWFYIAAWEKLEAAREQIRAEAQKSVWGPGSAVIEVADFDNPISLEQAAKKAKISLWRARRATSWHRRAKEFGNLS